MARIEPDQAALEIAHRLVAPRTTFGDAMRTPAIKRAIETRARKHMRDRSRFDLKKLQAADAD